MLSVFLMRAALFAVAYLLGSISSAIIVCRLCALPDPRQQGSGNPGVTNVLRIGGKRAAAMTLLGDFLKGFLPVLLTKLLGMGDTVQAFVALCATLGHVFPVFFRFRGGKGIATIFGITFALSWILGILCAITWLAVAKLSRYSSLAGIVMLVLLPCFSLFLLEPLALVPMLMISALVMWRHRQNITRLMKGEEPKLRR
jgi:acyl phosphate:glycerol-3-phosphate acyltransferase